MKTTQKTLLAAAVAVLAAPGTWAQTGPAPTQTLRQTTVTGSSIDDRFGDSTREPTSTVSLSGREIEAQHADNLVQVLNAQGRAGEWIDKSREIFEEQTERLMGAFEAGKDAMREEIRRGSSPTHG